MVDVYLEINRLVVKISYSHFIVNCCYLPWSAADEGETGKYTSHSYERLQHKQLENHVSVSLLTIKIAAVIVKNIL